MITGVGKIGKATGLVMDLCVGVVGGRVKADWSKHTTPVLG